jgi:hypothetical protein
LSMRASLLSTSVFPNADVSKYSVLILPSGGYRQLLGKEGGDKLRSWIDNGGTLIAIDDAAVFCADTSSRLSQVRLRSQVLKDLPLFLKAAEKEKLLEVPKIDSIVLWEGKKKTETAETKKNQTGTPDIKELETEDALARLMMPRGAILRAEPDEEHWLNFGIGEKLSVLAYSSNVLLSKDPVQTAIRFSKSDALRLSGLLWPEAREAWAQSAYLTREGRGKGQIVLFADDPVFRGASHGTARLLLNAIFYGPGFGTAVTTSW